MKIEIYFPKKENQGPVFLMLGEWVIAHSFKSGCWNGLFLEVIL